MKRRFVFDKAPSAPLRSARFNHSFKPGLPPVLCSPASLTAQTGKKLRNSEYGRVVRAQDADAGRDFLAMDGCDPAYGVRPLRRLIQREIGDKLARMLLSGEAGNGATVTVDADPSDSTPGLKLTARE